MNISRVHIGDRRPRFDVVMWAVVVAWLPALAVGQQVVLDQIARGWYDENGFNELVNPNYFVGDCRGPVGGFCGAGDLRNFFVFDFADVQGTFTSAALSLYLPPVDGFFSDSPSETYQLVEVTSDIFDLALGAGGVTAHQDLGSGTVYATRDINAFDGGSQMSIPLNAAALADINANPDFFAIGGSITTLNQFFDDEYAFAFTAIPEYLTQLILGTTPQPGDFNGDSLFDCTDIDLLVATVADGTHDIHFDLTGDGQVNRSDVDAWLIEAGSANLPGGIPYPVGDANLDGVVDVADFEVWNGHKFSTLAAWCSGDFNADGAIDVSDFNLWNNNKLTTGGTALAVPEPPLILPWCGAVFACWAWTRQAARR